MPDRLPAALIARLVRTRHAGRALEPADLGTAYGLDFRLDLQAKDSCAAKAEGPAAPTWIKRWFRRGLAR